MLMRTTFAIELIAILCFELLRIFRKESSALDKLPSVLISAALFLAYFLWNKHLRDLYGTIFLNELLPPEDWQDAKELIADTYNKWTFHYFQRFQYVIFLIIIILSIGISIHQVIKNKDKATANSLKRPLSIWWLPLIELFGCVLFSIAMMQQLPFHDYYLIDTFFLPLLLMLALLLSKVSLSHSYAHSAAIGIIAVACGIMINGAENMQKQRRTEENEGLISYQRFEGSDLLLDSLNIPRDAKILCLYGFAQNGPFIQMGRKGYSVMTDDEDLLRTAYSWDFDYVVIENGKFQQHFTQHQELLSKLKKIGGNEKITVCTANNNWVYQVDWQFFYPSN